MSLSVFNDKYTLPSEKDVAEVLEGATQMWDDVKHYIEKYGAITEEWKIYSKKAGWCKKILLVSGKEERNIIFLYPNLNYFTCILVFGEKAVLAAEKSQLPDNILDTITSAKQYREGCSFNIEVRSQTDLEVLKKLIDIKIQV